MADDPPGTAGSEVLRRLGGEVSYRRTRTGEEVDLVIEAGDRLLPIEAAS